MELVFFKFKSDTSDIVEAVATTPDGKIDYCELSNTFGLEPYSIRLCAVVFPKDKNLLTLSSWTEIKKLLPVTGTKEHPVLVTANPRPAAPTAGQAIPEQDDRFLKLLEQMLTRFQVGARQKVYRISEVNSTIFKEIQSSGGVEGIHHVEGLFGARIHIARDVPPFKWGDGVESGQAGGDAGYVNHVQQHLVQLNQKWSVIGGNRHPGLLDGTLGGSGEGTVFKGTTDVVVVEKGAENIPETGLKIIFEAEVLADYLPKSFVSPWSREKLAFFLRSLKPG